MVSWNATDSKEIITPLFMISIIRFKHENMSWGNFL